MGMYIQIYSYKIIYAHPFAPSSAHGPQQQTLRAELQSEPAGGAAAASTASSSRKRSSYLRLADAGLLKSPLSLGMNSASLAILCRNRKAFVSPAPKAQEDLKVSYAFSAQQAIVVMTTGDFSKAVLQKRFFAHSLG